MYLSKIKLIDNLFPYCDIVSLLCIEKYITTLWNDISWKSGVLFYFLVQ